MTLRRRKTLTADIRTICSSFSLCLHISLISDVLIDWFDSVSGLSVAELYVPKETDIFAGRMRELLTENRFDEWEEYCDERLWSGFSEMREIVLATRENNETSSI